MLSCSTTLATSCTDKSRGIVVGSVQAVAASKRQKPAGKGAKGSEGHHGTLRHTEVPNGVSSIFVKCWIIAKLFCYVQGPCETGETGPILAWYLHLFVQNWKCRTSSIAILYHPPVGNEELRLSFLLAHCIANGERDLTILLSLCTFSLAVANWRCAFPRFPLRKHCWSLMQVLESHLSMDH